MSTGRAVDLCKKKKALSHEDFEKEYGRHWIWAALDPESKLLINVFIGQRTLEDCKVLIGNLVKRIRTEPLCTSDELPHYQTALVEHFSHLENYPKTDKRCRPERPRMAIDPELQYAAVHKTRADGKGVKVERDLIFCNQELIDQMIEASKIGKRIISSFERSNLTLRNHNSHNLLQFFKTALQFNTKESIWQKN